MKGPVGHKCGLCGCQNIGRDGVTVVVDCEPPDRNCQCECHKEWRMINKGNMEKAYAGK